MPCSTFSIHPATTLLYPLTDITQSRFVSISISLSLFWLVLLGIVHIPKTCSTSHQNIHHIKLGRSFSAFHFRRRTHFQIFGQMPEYKTHKAHRLRWPRTKRAHCMPLPSSSSSPPLPSSNPSLHPLRSILARFMAIAYIYLHTFILYSPPPLTPISFRPRPESSGITSHRMLSHPFHPFHRVVHTTDILHNRLWTEKCSRKYSSSVSVPHSLSISLSLSRFRSPCCFHASLHAHFRCVKHNFVCGGEYGDRNEVNWT